MWNQARRLPKQTTALLPPTQTSAEGARHHSRGSQTLRPPEKDDSTGVEPVVAVGRAGGDSCYVPVEVEGVPCDALVDTGSTITLVRAEVLPSGTMFEPTAVRLRTVTGELAAMKGRGVLSVSVGGVEVRHPVWIADVQDLCILGLDFLKATGCLLDLQAGQFPTCHPRAAPPEHSPPPSTPDGGRRGSVCSIGGVEEELWRPESRAAGAIGAAPARVPEQFRHEGGGGGPNTSGGTRDRYGGLAAHQVSPAATPPGSSAGLRRGSAEHAAGRHHRALRQTVVMVPKKTGGWRLCSDYRPVNGVTKKDSYPLPRIDESLDLVAGSSWFSSLDLRSGYYQVPLAPEARPKTAFCTGRGLWQFKVLSFGLCNAPATFVRLMDRVLSGIPRQQCLVYLDDILVHGSSFEAALGSLKVVLERIRAAGLKLHPDKCHFLQREVTFLGHKVGGEGIGTLHEKVQAVTGWPNPRNQKQLKSFLGLASYYRKFLRGFACIAAPLFQLLQKDREFLWSEQCQAAFDGLRRALSEAPVLVPANPRLPFTLDTDASGVGVG
ncbi:uncharacterized protein LOC117545404 [Gymnodraco acuticeps]|uniref:ribonuclease H n=1 Tax=Gymnodraco acuticeps TaxID=8218 RepID=A0A6P8U2V7_GYMAC|nr:uncharacterized protein LOC117545404 [Gymnodraco acuticeps]